MNNGFSNDEFQIINMNYKLKKIKNKKQKHNYKKTKFFDVLDNEIQANVTVKSESPEASEKKEVEAFSNNDIPFEKMKEGYVGFGKGLDFTKNDKNYDGIDNIDDTMTKSKFKLEDIKKEIEDAINWLYDNINGLNDIIAGGIANILSNGKNNDADKKLIRNYIAWTEAIGISCYVVYNWFYILYYHSVDNVKLYKVSIEGLKKIANSPGGYGVILHFFLFFFEYALWFPETLDWVLTGKFAEYTKRYFHASFMFSIIFVYFCIFFKNSIMSFRDIFITTLRGEVDWFSGIIMAITFILYFRSVMADATQYFFNKPERNLWPPPSAKGTVLFMLVRLLRFTIIFMFSVPLAALLVMLYILGYSLFGMFIYKFLDTFKMFGKINDYVSATKSTHIPDACEDKPWYTFFYDILLTLMDLIHLCQTKLFSITFISLYIAACFKYSTDISTNSLQSGLYAINICVIMIILVGSGLIKKIMKLATNGEEGELPAMDSASTSTASTQAKLPIIPPTPSSIPVPKTNPGAGSGAGSGAGAGAGALFGSVFTRLGSVLQAP